MNLTGMGSSANSQMRGLNGQDPYDMDEYRRQALQACNGLIISQQLINQLISDVMAEYLEAVILRQYQAAYSYYEQSAMEPDNAFRIFVRDWVEKMCGM